MKTLQLNMKVKKNNKQLKEFCKKEMLKRARKKLNYDFNKNDISIETSFFEEEILDPVYPKEIRENYNLLIGRISIVKEEE